MKRISTVLLWIKAGIGNNDIYHSGDGFEAGVRSFGWEVKVPTSGNTGQKWGTLGLGRKRLVKYQFTVCVTEAELGAMLESPGKVVDGEIK
jgi:hypothetical protein